MSKPLKLLIAATGLVVVPVLVVPLRQSVPMQPRPAVPVASTEVARKKPVSCAAGRFIVGHRSAWPNRTIIALPREPDELHYAAVMDAWRKVDQFRSIPSPGRLYLLGVIEAEGLIVVGTEFVITEVEMLPDGWRVSLGVRLAAIDTTGCHYEIHNTHTEIYRCRFGVVCLEDDFDNDKQPITIGLRYTRIGTVRRDHRGKVK